jgi:hypothetical protein
VFPDWPSFVATQEVLIAMRFSYFGNSGWKSEFSKNPGLLFDEDRLKMRLALLETLPLPSLVAQTDQNFHLMVLCSETMPDWALDTLAEICGELLPAGRFTIAPRPYGFAHRHLTLFMADRYGPGLGIHAVLDDDDALAIDFVATLREVLGGLPPMEVEDDMRFVSFPNGYGLTIEDGEVPDYRLYLHRYPYINLGLSMVAATGGKNLFSIRHRKTPAEYNCRLYRRKTMFIRSVNPVNDSRVEVSDKWEPVLNWRTHKDVRNRFPFLAEI